MAATLPYLSSPGTVDTALQRIREAATPSRFTNDFVSAVLQVKGGAGRSIPPFLKKLGLLNADGTPTVLYDGLRNESTSGRTVAQAMRTGYRPLYEANEYAHELSDGDLRGLILQVTGLEKNNRAAQYILLTYKKLRAHADFAAVPDVETLSARGPSPRAEPGTRRQVPASGRSISFSHTINLNLPATTNIEVFNAIFKSLKEHLIDE